MAGEPTLGVLLGVSGLVDVPGGSASFVVEKENVLSWSSTVTPRVIDVTGFDGPNDAVADSGSQKVICVSQGGGGYVQARIRSRSLIGLSNLNSPTSGRGTLTEQLGNGNKVTHTIRMTGVTFTKQSKQSPLIVSFNWTKDGAVTEAADS